MERSLRDEACWGSERWLDSSLTLTEQESIVQPDPCKYNTPRGFVPDGGVGGPAAPDPHRAGRAFVSQTIFT